LLPGWWIITAWQSSLPPNKASGIPGNHCRTLECILMLLHKGSYVASWSMSEQQNRFWWVPLRSIVSK
jgi:hypothetical protein